METAYRKIYPSDSRENIINPGMGYQFIQRGKDKVRFDKLAATEWFLAPPLTDKIIFDVPWSVIEPEKGRYDWHHRDWEGAMQSWIDAGYKVGIQVRGMGARGTLYDDGAPQWLFDAGAQYIDEPAAEGVPPHRYPVYWDPIYLEHSARLTAALGERYNRHPAIAMVFPGFLGHFGEMHISEHSSIRPWVEAGFCRRNYVDALKRQTENFKAAFPDKEIFQELGNPSYNNPDPACEVGPMSIIQAREIVPYLVDRGINLKYNGLGANWDRWGEDQFIEGWYIDYCQAYYHRVKLIVENIATFHAPGELASLRHCHASYTNRGGELAGLPETMIDRIHGDHFRPMENYDPLSKMQYLAATKNHPEQRRAVQFEAARIVGYRLLPVEIHFPAVLERDRNHLLTSFWENRGAAKPYEDFGILYALLDDSDECVWEQVFAPVLPTSSMAWDSGRRVGERTELRLPRSLPPGDYRLAVGMRRLADGEIIRLPLSPGETKARHPLGPIQIV